MKSQYVPPHVLSPEMIRHCSRVVGDRDNEDARVNGMLQMSPAAQLLRPSCPAPDFDGPRHRYPAAASPAHHLQTSPNLLPRSQWKEIIQESPNRAQYITEELKVSLLLQAPIEPIARAHLNWGTSHAQVQRALLSHHAPSPFRQDYSSSKPMALNLGGLPHPLVAS
jgi:hypothetical protein